MTPLGNGRSGLFRQSISKSRMSFRAYEKAATHSQETACNTSVRPPTLPNERAAERYNKVSAMELDVRKRLSHARRRTNCLVQVGNGRNFLMRRLPTPREPHLGTRMVVHGSLGKSLNIHAAQGCSKRTKSLHLVPQISDRTNIVPRRRAVGEQAQGRID